MSLTFDIFYRNVWFFLIKLLFSREEHAEHTFRVEFRRNSGGTSWNFFFSVYYTYGNQIQKPTHVERTGNRAYRVRIENLKHFKEIIKKYLLGDDLRPI